MSEKIVGKAMQLDLTDGSKRSQAVSERMQVSGQWRCNCDSLRPLFFSQLITL
jgi:hypothetical protein